jgi:chemotaxis protein CheX
MSITELTPEITAERIAEITRDIWGSFLSLELEQLPDAGEPLSGETLTGIVHISGAWDGSVFVEVTRAHAEGAAEAMFAAEPGTLSREEVGDALGELTNMVGGNVKGLLGVTTKLSLPSIAGGESYTLRIPGAEIIDQVLLVSVAGPVRISVWQVAQ